MPVPADELSPAPAALPRWRYVAEAGALTRAFVLPDFVRAFSFMTAVAIVAQEMNHHPEFHNVYNRVTITLTTHDAGGVTGLDLELAARIDRLAPDSG